MYNPFVSVVVYNPTRGHIVMYVFFLSSHLRHFRNIVLANTEAMNILHMFPMHMVNVFHELFFSLGLEIQLILAH